MTTAITTSGTPNTDPIDDEDIRRAAASLDETQNMWSRLSAMYTPTAPCATCHGAGELAGGGGVFGAIPCTDCDGNGQVEHPLADILALPMPNFEPARTKLLAMGQALDQHKRYEYEQLNPEAERTIDREPPPLPTKDQLLEVEVAIADIKENARKTAMEKHEEMQQQKQLGGGARARGGARGSLAAGGGTSLDGGMGNLEVDDDGVID